MYVFESLGGDGNLEIEYNKERDGSSIAVSVCGKKDKLTSNLSAEELTQLITHLEFLKDKLKESDVSC